MSKTYEALKKAEAERASRRNASFSPADPVVLPSMPARQPTNINLSEIDPAIEEEYQKLRGNLFAGPGKEGLQTVMLVSVDHGEGVTTTSIALATVLARANVGKIALIDANVRTPAFHDLFTPSGSGKGLTDLLVNGTNSHDLVQETKLPNLWVIQAGRPLRSPSHLYQGPIVDLLDQLRKDFRYILLDCPPAKDYADSSFLAPKVDGIVLVLRAERTKIEAAVKVKRQLEWAGGHVVGAVFNGKKSYIPFALERFL